MKASIFRAAFLTAIASTGVASAQYNGAAAPRSPYLAQPATVQATPTFRPINPAGRPAQPTLVANRTPTAAPPQVQPASSTPTVASRQPMPSYQPPMNGQPWIAPTPTMGTYDANVSGYGAAGGGAMPAGGPVAEPAMDYSYGGGGDCCGGGCDSGCGTCGGCCGLCGHRCCIPWKTTGDLVQHMPFFGTTHGYYYFRPYHVMHVFSQQELATRWGGDPRNPYDNTMFQRVYEQMGVEAKPVATKAATPSSVPTGLPEEYVVPPGHSMTMPTPVPMYGPGGVPMYQAPSNVTPLPQIESVPAR